MRRAILIIIIFSLACYGIAQKGNMQYINSLAKAIPHSKTSNESAQNDTKPYLGFKENKGQWDERVLYEAITANGSVYLEKDKFTFVYISDVEHNHGHPCSVNNNENEYNDDVLQMIADARFHAYKIHFQNCSQDVLIESLNKRREYFNYFIGNDETKWKSGVNAYNRIEYKRLYPGIDLAVYSENSNFKYDFIVHQTGDVNSIVLNYEGVNSLRLENNNLIVETSLYELVELAPFAYQIINGEKKEVECHYQLNGNIISFVLPEGYDVTRELIIDPELVGCTFAGTMTGSYTFGSTSTFDDDGNIYVGSRCFSSNYPVTTGAFQVTYPGGYETTAISKYAPDATSLIYATFLGGSYNESPHSLIVNSNDEIYVLADTWSPDYPTTGNAYDNTANSGYDIAITCLNSTGTGLIGSTFLGGSEDDGYGDYGWMDSNPYDANGFAFNYGDDRRGEIFLDDQGNVYIACITRSADFPVTSGAVQSTLAGEQDGVICKLNPDLSNLLVSTYFGGTDNDAAYGIRIEPGTGNILITGTTGVNSHTWNGAITSTQCKYTGYVMKLSPNGSNIIANSYFGSDVPGGRDDSFFIDYDSEGDIYIYGETYESGGIVPSPGVYSNPGSSNFVAKFTSDLSTIEYQTVIGNGGTTDRMVPIAFRVDFCDRLYFCGHAPSIDAAADTYNGDGYPLVDPLFTYGGLYIGVLDSGAVDLIFGSYLPGANHVDGGTSRFDSKGYVYQAVCSCRDLSDDMPTTPGAYSPTRQCSQCDLGVYKIHIADDILQALFEPDFDTVCAPGVINFTNNSINGITYLWDFGDGTTSTEENPSHNYPDTGTYEVTLIAYNPSACITSDTVSHIITVIDLTAEANNNSPVCEGEELMISADSYPESGTANYIWTGPDGFSYNGSNDTVIVSSDATTSMAGEYFVTVTNSFGCTAVASTIVVINPPPVISGISYEPLCFGGDDGSIDITPSGATPPYTYIWDTGATTEDIDNIPAGDYSVTVSDQNGCTAVETFTVTDPPQIVLTTDTVSEICGQCNGSVTVYASGGTPVYTYLWDDPAGQNTQTASDLCSGTYTVTVTDSNGCTSVDSATIDPTDIPDPVISGTDVTCYGFSDGAIDLTVTGGTPGYIYFWSNGATDEDLNNIPAGEYYVTVTDNMNCTSEASITISEPPELITSVTGEDVTCYGYNDGSVDLTVSGGTPGYSFIWSPGGETTEDITNLGPGTYSVTVTDANNCTTVESYTVYEPPELLLTITSTPISASGECDGTATVTPTGGTPGYTYLWDDPAQQTTQTAIDLCSGTYCVTVTDANGCTNDICIYISSIAIEITGTDLLCYGDCDGTATVTVTMGDNPPFTYMWDDPAQQVTATATGLCAGTYSVTVTDDLGITATASITINQPPELGTSLTGVNILCFGGNNGTTDLEVTGGTPGYTYLWSPGGEILQDLSGLPAGQYEVTVTDANQCTAVNNIILTEPPVLTSVISGSDQLCTGDEIGTVDVEVDGGTPPYTYFWQPTDETTQEIDSLPSGEYEVLITDANGCTTTNSIIIDEPYPILTQMTGTDVLCYGYTDGTAGVTASGGTQPYIYYWDTGDNTQNISNIGVGTYNVTVTDQNNCTTTDNITINEPPELIVNIPDPGWICIGESATLIANASGGTPGYFYEWNNGIMDEWNNVSPDVTASYSVVVTDVNNCIANANVTVSVYGPLSIQVYPDDTICAGESATIYAGYSGGMGEPYTLTLNGNTVIETPYIVSPIVTTVYQICVNDNCTTPQACDDVEIVVMPDPPVNFVADIYEGCEPLQVHFNEINVHEGQTYLWNFGDPWGSTTGYSKNPVHTFENPGIYDVSCTVTSAFGCTSTWTWYEMIWVWPNPVAAFFPYPQVATIIEPYIYFENNSSTYYITNWTFGDGDSSNVIHPQHKYDSPGTYNVMLAVETEHGCVDTTWSEIVIQDIITFYAPTAFSPDFDQMNALFSPIGHGIDPDNWHLMIYDRWGEKVWETNIYDVDEETGEVRHGWDGTIRGRNIGETAVYSWLVVYRDVTGAEHQHAGLVTLIR